MEKEGRKIHVVERAQVRKRWTIGEPHDDHRERLSSLTEVRQVNYSSTKSRKTAIQRIRSLSGQLSFLGRGTGPLTIVGHVHARHTRRLA